MNPEKEINLTVLQQRDPYITSISDSASQVAIYSFNSDNNEWEKTNVEGTLFVYKRSAYPLNGFMVINRLDPRDLIEPIDKNLEFQLQDHFLLYRNAKGNIIGIWFYDKKECLKINKLLNSLVKVSTRYLQQSDTVRPRGLSESESITEKVELSNNDANIMQMLLKAQNEYDKVKYETSMRKNRTTPGDLKVKDLKVTNGESNHSQINLDSLFQMFSIQHNDPKFNQNNHKLLNNQEINESIKNNSSNKDLDKNKAINQNPSKNSFPKLNSISNVPMINEVENFFKLNNNQAGDESSLSQDNNSQVPTHIPTASNIFQQRKNSPSTTIQQITNNQSIMSQHNKVLATNSTTPSGNNLFNENILTSLSRIKTNKVNYPMQPICNNSNSISNINVPRGSIKELVHNLTSSVLKTDTLLNGPDKYTSSSYLNDSLVNGDVLLSPMVFQSLPANKKQTNISPNINEEHNKFSTAGHNSNENITPLTKQQFQLALINLLKNDSNFLSMVHEAYLSCFNSENS